MHWLKQKSATFGLVALLLFLVACGGSTREPIAVSSSTDSEQTTQTEDAIAEQERFSADKYADLEIVTLLPRDAIPAIDNPEFLSVDEANEVYDSDELVIGVVFNGDARAYSVPLLSNHEIVNDTVGGVKLAVTW